MKKSLFYPLVLILILSVDLSIAAEPDVNDLVPLSKYVKKNDLKDPAAITYVYDRCIGLFLAFAVGAKNEKGTEAERFAANARAAYADIAKANALLMLKTAKDPDAAQKEHTEVAQRLQKIYTNRMDKVMDLGQDLMEDAIVGADLNVCGEVLKHLRSKN